jgi:predicted DNA-binding protein (MmcQ/YjbR family)
MLGTGEASITIRPRQSQLAQSQGAAISFRAVTLDKLRRVCLALPGTTEQIQWGDDLVFKVGGRMFAVAATDPGAANRLAFKCSDEGFAELVERDGVVPAPYLARAKWVSLERFDALSDKEIERRIAEAYELVFAKLTKKDQAAIRSKGAARKRPVADTHGGQSKGTVKGDTQS